MQKTIPKKFLSLIALFLVVSTGFLACAPNKIISKKVSKEFNKSAVISKYQVGFALYDVEKSEMIYQKDAAKYYTPASNTKLFTFYAGIKVLGDSIPSLRYIEKGDSLIFWGTGDPSFLHSVLKGTNAFNLLKQTNKKLFFASGRYTGDFYGNGWQWDDYNAYYQAEINELPLFDNMVLVNSATAGNMKITPQSFATCFVVDSAKTTGVFRVTREFNANVFSRSNVPIPAKFEQQIPYKVSTALTVNLLADTLNKYVGVLNLPMPKDAKTVYNTKSDSVFKQLMLPSDNFVAEQLLLVYADKLGLPMNTAAVINHIEKNYLTALPDKPKWLDGSGLSRGNLFTPRSMIKLLELIYAEYSDKQKLYSLLPAGGKSGTLRNAYPKTDTPFVFGKTGSLTGVHNQSGYLITKKGKTYLFSFMNNNFVLPTADVRNEMVRVMTLIHDKF